MNLHVAHELLMKDPAYRKESERMARRERRRMNARRPVPAPQVDMPLGMEIPESPHWPLPRSRTERDRIAALLNTVTGGRYSATIEALRFEPTLKNREALHLCVNRNTRSVHQVRRLYLFAAYVAALEARAAAQAHAA